MEELVSFRTAEESVIQKHHNDLQQVIINPLDVASKLLQEGMVSRTLVSEVNTLGRSQLQNSTAIIAAVSASIHSKPNQFQVFMSVLEDNPASANLAMRMRNELSTLQPERLKRKGWRYTVSAEYKEDFIDLQDSFGNMFNCSCEALRSHVSVTTLKEYLCRTFPELVIPLEDVTTIDDVMTVVRNKSSLTDFAYFKVIANKFGLRKMKQIVAKYRKTLNSFCQHTLHNHSYVRSFLEDYPRYILSSEEIVFKLQWNTNERTLKDIRDVLRMCFGHLADRVQIAVIEDGSVVVVCCAPQYLMEELVRQASGRVHKLKNRGVVKLTVGGTEVIVEKASVNPTSEMPLSRRVTLQRTHQLMSNTDTSSDVHLSDIIWFWTANHCFLFSFILEITLILFNLFILTPQLNWVMLLGLVVLLVLSPLIIWLSPVQAIQLIDIMILVFDKLFINDPLFSRYTATMIWLLKSFCKGALYTQLAFFRDDQMQQEFLLEFSTVVPYYFTFCVLASFVFLVYKPLGYIFISLSYSLYVVVGVLNYIQDNWDKKLAFLNFFVSGSFLCTLREAIGVAIILNWDTTNTRNLIITLFQGLFGALLIINQRIIDMSVVWKVISMISVLNIIAMCYYL